METYILQQDLPNAKAGDRYEYTNNYGCHAYYRNGNTDSLSWFLVEEVKDNPNWFLPESKVKEKSWDKYRLNHLITYARVTSSKYSVDNVLDNFFESEKQKL